MMHSEYVKAAEAAISEVKRSVRYRGLNTAGGWIRNPLEVNQKFIARLASKIVGAQMDAQYTGGFNGAYYVEQLDKLGRISNTGNCSELSAVAFMYLDGQQIRSIDYFGVFRGIRNHAFVVLNRDKNTPLEDFASWSYSAVVCDPLYDRAADAGFLATWYPWMFPLQKQDVMHRLD